MKKAKWLAYFSGKPAPSQSAEDFVRQKQQELLTTASTDPVTEWARNKWLYEKSLVV